MIDAPARAMSHEPCPGAAPMRRFALLLAIAGGFAMGVPSFGQTSEVSPEQTIRRLVRQLGAEDYADRSAAAERLRRIGMSAAPFLDDDAIAFEPEVRLRAVRVLAAIRREDLQRRVSEFLKHPEQNGEHLPAWPRFSQFAGDTPESRSLFARMLHAEPELMQLIAGSQRALQAEVDLRLTEFNFLAMHNGAQHPSVETVCALLFASLNGDWTEFRSGADAAFANSTNSMFPSLLRQGKFSKQVQDEAASLEQDPKAPSPVRSLLAGWVQTPTAGRAGERMQVGANFQLTQCVTPARELLAEHTEDRRNLQQAMLLIARHGQPDCVPELESYLHDRTVFGASTINGHHSELRAQDTALLAVVKLTKQDPKEYGFKEVVEHEIYGYLQTSAKLESDAVRTAGMRRWDRWRTLKLQQMLTVPLDAIMGADL